MRRAKAGRRPARQCYHQSDFGVRVYSTSDTFSILDSAPAQHQIYRAIVLP